MSRSGVDRWDKFWRRDDVCQFNIHAKLIDSICRHVGRPPMTILEVGPGTGSDSIHLANMGYNIVVIDFSYESLALVKRNANERGISLLMVRGDALLLPFKANSVDLIFHQGLAEHFDSPDRLIREQTKALKYNGHIIIDVPQTFTFYTIKKHWLIFRNKWFAGWETQYTVGKLKRLAKRCRLKPVEFFGYHYDLVLVDALSHISTLGSRRYGIVPKLIGNLIQKIWDRLEKTSLWSYIQMNIVMVAKIDPIVKRD
jgi:ubiquinone/menaquinone biosynthesis C-methylase UbiE